MGYPGWRWLEDDERTKNGQNLVSVWVKGVNDGDIEVWRNGELIETCTGGEFMAIGDAADG